MTFIRDPGGLQNVKVTAAVGRKIEPWRILWHSLCNLKRIYSDVLWPAEPPSLSLGATRRGEDPIVLLGWALVSMWRLWAATFDSAGPLGPPPETSLYRAIM